MNLIAKMFCPKEIGENELNICKKINNNIPFFIKVTPHISSLPNECHNNVAKYIDKNGGKIVYGWCIWKSKIMIEAQFHSVWESEDGELRDITPQSDGSNKILFLKDNKNSYQGFPLNSVRVALIDHELIHNLISFADLKYEASLELSKFRLPYKTNFMKIYEQNYKNYDLDLIKKLHDSFEKEYNLTFISILSNAQINRLIKLEG